jgi:hypothetical protein
MAIVNASDLRPKPPFDRRPKALFDVWAKLRRAREHLADARAYIEAKESPAVERGPRRTDPDDPSVVHRGEIRFPIDERLPNIVGDVIQCLRTTLDYLISDLAWVDSGKIPETRTQFVITDKATTFADSRESALWGLSDQHRSDIEALQPYNGCRWTALLRDYSNPDKHRHPVAVSWSGRMPFALSVTAGSARTDTHVIESQYNLPDGRPLIETLAMLEREVSRLVQRFHDELKAAGVPVADEN